MSDEELPDDPRELIKQVIKDRRLSRAWLSEKLGRNETYIQQFLTKHTPRRLNEVDRKTLAGLLGVAPERLMDPAERHLLVNDSVTNDATSLGSGGDGKLEERQKMLEGRVSLHDHQIADVLDRLRKLEARLDAREAAKQNPQKRG